jgi:hypothetical protein
MTSGSDVVVEGIVSVGGAGAGSGARAGAGAGADGGADKVDEDGAVVLAFGDRSASFSACFSLCIVEFGSVNAEAVSSMSAVCARDEAMHGTNLRTSFDRNDEFERVLDDFGLDGLDAVLFAFSPLTSEEETLALGRAGVSFCVPIRVVDSDPLSFSTSSPCEFF